MNHRQVSGTQLSRNARSSFSSVKAFVNPTADSLLPSKVSQCIYAIFAKILVGLLKSFVFDNIF